MGILVIAMKVLEFNSSFEAGSFLFHGLNAMFFYWLWLKMSSNLLVQQATCDHVLAFSRDRHWCLFCFNLFPLVCSNFPFPQMFVSLFQCFPVCSTLLPLIPTYYHRFLLRSNLFSPFPSYSHFLSACSIGSLQCRVFPLTHSTSSQLCLFRILAHSG